MTLQNIHAGSPLAKRFINGGYIPDNGYYCYLSYSNEEFSKLYKAEKMKIHRKIDRWNERVKGKIGDAFIAKMENEYGTKINMDIDWDKLTESEKQILRNQDIRKSLHK